MPHKETFFACLGFVVFCFTGVFAQESLKKNKHNNLIINYLKENKTKYGFNDEDLKNLYVTNDYFSESTDITHVYLSQAYDGIRVFNAISSVAIKDDTVFYYANRFLKDLKTKVSATKPKFSPQSAIEKIAADYDLGTIQNLQQLELKGNQYKFSNGDISTKNILVELVFVKTPNGLRLAWDFTIYKTDNSHWWNARVDALSNDILEVEDLILTCTFEKNHNHNTHSRPFGFFNEATFASTVLVDGSNYNVFALPTESPSHGSRQIVSNPADFSASPFGWHDVNGVAGAEFSIARGNNVWAKEDADGENSIIGFSPNGTSSLNFDFPLDFNLAPAQYKEAAVTNLFYINNMMHDIWYNHGFDESAGNFQTKNYSNLGLDNDFVFADAQDGSGFNNANFGTPQDGFSPRMQMFLWSPPGFQGEPLTIENGALAGVYNGVEAGFGGRIGTNSITSNLALTTDAVGDLFDACQTLTNGAQLAGNIAILKRGGCEFGTKVLAAENAGAIAAIVVNNVIEGSISMGPGAEGDLVTIPSIMISQADGEALIAALQNGESITATLSGPDLTDFLDGDFDNGIIAHEYGHGISNRLAGGPFTVTCLQNEEQMGEGWSDWFGLMVTLKASDLPQNPRGIGTFVISQANNGSGIRPARYSTDFVINNFTYDASNLLSKPHGIGFVWATALWDLTWAYVNKYGFDPDLYNGTGGNNRVMQLVIDGLKLQPCLPGFIDGRDALLAADLATTGGQDQCMIWEVFAARGLGFNAQQGDSDNRTDQVEDFSLPPSSNPSLVNCSSLDTNEFSIETLSVYPNPTNTQLNISSTLNHIDVKISLIDINGRTVFETQSDLFDTVNVNTSLLKPGLYILNIKGDTIDYNTKIIKN